MISNCSCYRSPSIYSSRILESLADVTRTYSTKKEKGSKKKRVGRKDDDCTLDPRPRSTVSAWPLSLKARAPVAPGMFTYRFPPNVFASGILRFGGIALGVGFTGVVLGSAALYVATAKRLGHFITAFGKNVPRPLICAGKMCVCFPLLGHLLGGLRDMGWHFGIQSLEQAYCRRTSLAIIILSLAGSGALAFTRFPYTEQDI